MVVRMHMAVVEVMVETVQVLRETTVSGVSMGMMVLMGRMVLLSQEILDIIMLVNKVVMELKVPLDLLEIQELMGSLVRREMMDKLALL